VPLPCGSLVGPRAAETVGHRGLANCRKVGLRGKKRTYGGKDTHSPRCAFSRAIYNEEEPPLSEGQNATNKSCLNEGFVANLREDCVCEWCREYVRVQSGGKGMSLYTTDEYMWLNVVGSSRSDVHIARPLSPRLSPFCRAASFIMVSAISVKNDAMG